MAGLNVNVNDLPDQYEVARKRASQQTNAAVQGQQDAMKRRFSANGAINSGAAIKQQQLAAEAGQQQLQQANEAIDSAQRADIMRQKEAQDARTFAREERLGSQEFGAGQADLGRKFTGEQAHLGRQFQSSERQAGESFAGSQNAAQRALQQRMADQNDAFQNRVQSDAQWRFGIENNLANRQFAMDQDAQNFNKMIAEKQLDAANGGILGSLFGDAFGKGGGTGMLNYRAGAAGAVLGSVINPTAGFVAGGAGAGGGRGGITGYGI